MKLKVTPQNVRHINGMLKKIFSGGLKDVYVYAPTIKRNKTRKLLGLDSNWLVNGVEKSNVSVFETPNFETDYMHEKHFIRISNQNHDTYDENTFRAFIIYCGDVVEFKNTVVNVRAKRIANKEKCTIVISKI